MNHRALSALSLLMAGALAACQSAPVINPGLRQPASFNRANAGQLNKVAIRVQNPQEQTVPGEIVVKYRLGIAAQSRMQTLNELKLSTITPIGRPEMGLELVKVEQGIATEAALEALNRNPNVLYAEPNYVVSIPPVQPAQAPPPPTASADFPNDEMFGNQYAHKVSNSLEGWKLSQGSPDLVLAVVDTGVDIKHPDLAAKMVAGRDIVDNDDEAMDGHGHGTHCAGIAAAITNNRIGVAGFAPNVKIMPVRVLDNRGSGTSADVANGIIWAADNGARVISMSLGGRGNPKVKEDAVKYALSKDSVLVAAMGNYGDNSKIYPAAQEGVVAVGATDNRDTKASFSQYGEWISVSAPGVNILSTFPTYTNGMGRKDYGSISGTSMATPAVAGVVALIRSVFPDMNREQVRAQLQQGTDDLGEPGYDIYFGHGRINVAKALTLPGRR